MIEYKGKDKAPCKNCEQRNAGCHAECTAYAEWLAELQREKNLFWKAEGASFAHKSILSRHKYENIKSRQRRRS